jgi:hypothetical protein
LQDKCTTGNFDTCAAMKHWEGSSSVSPWCPPRALAGLAGLASFMLHVRQFHHLVVRQVRVPQIFVSHRIMLGMTAPFRTHVEDTLHSDRAKFVRWHVDVQAGIGNPQEPTNSGLETLLYLGCMSCSLRGVLSPTRSSGTRIRHNYVWVFG